MRHRVRVPRSVAAMAVVFLLAAGSASGQVPEQARNGAQEPDGAVELLDMIAVWLASNFELPESFEHPALVLASPDDLARLRYGGPDGDPEEVVAVYSDVEQTIYLGEDWDGRTPAGLSVVVHEMVHHLQDAAEMRFACPGEREALAYEAQERWLQLFGTSLAREFAIDPMTLMLRSSCAY